MGLQFPSSFYRSKQHYVTSDAQRYQISHDKRASRSWWLGANCQTQQKRCCDFPAGQYVINILLSDWRPGEIWTVSVSPVGRYNQQQGQSLFLLRILVTVGNFGIFQVLIYRIQWFPMMAHYKEIILKPCHNGRNDVLPFPFFTIFPVKVHFLYSAHGKLFIVKSNLFYLKKHVLYLTPIRIRLLR